MGPLCWRALSLAALACLSNLLCFRAMHASGNPTAAQLAPPELCLPILDNMWQHSGANKCPYEASAHGQRP